MTQDHGFAVTRHRHGDTVTLSVIGVVDEVTAPSLATQLDVAMTEQPNLLVVDLTAVHFMSTSGINLLVEVQRLTASTATTLRVAADGPATSRPLHLLGIEHLIELYPTADDARRGRRASVTPPIRSNELCPLSGVSPT